MGASPPEPPREPAEGRLDSWKEIAAYLKRDVTTVQRWEKREGMPVRRHVHDKLGSVYAFRSELDAWARSRRPAPAAEGSTSDAAHDQETDGGFPEPDPPAPLVRRPTRSRLRWPLMAGAFALALAIGTAWTLLEGRDAFWRDPLVHARFENITDFGGNHAAAAISRDGKFVAFLSDRDGRMDVWVTQIGTGQFYNLSGGRFPDLVNPSVRTIGFSPDAALVTFWARGGANTPAQDINIWAVPTLGGEPRPYLEHAAELDWSYDGSRLVYHTPGPGDPMFVRGTGDRTAPTTPLFATSAGLHGHFQTWSRSDAFIYFVQGSLPDELDIWRIAPAGGVPEQITHHHSRVSHPVLLDDRTLMYLATDGDGAGPWLYSMDVERRVPHRLGAGLDRYNSLSASADGRRVVATVANPKGTLWRLWIGDAPATTSAATAIPLTTGRGVAPRLGPGYLLYVSSNGTEDAIWKVAAGAPTELWREPGAHIVGGPELAPDGQWITFSVDRRGRKLLYVVKADGTSARIVTDGLDLRGGPSWTPDGRALTAAALVDGTPRLFRISLNGAAIPLVREYAMDPVWSPDGQVLLYSGADTGTTFPLKAATPAGGAYPFPALMLTRGGRRLRFLPGQRAVVIMRGDIRHKDLWLLDLATGVERRLTDLGADFDIRDFDISADGRELVLERVQEQSDVVVIDLTPHND